MDSNRTFLIADTHFGHSNIISFCKRPYENVYEMEEQLIYNWNSVVGKSDTIYMLGDFTFTSREKTIEIGNSLNGVKTLIMGNHDNHSPDLYHLAGFKYVINQPIIIDNFYILSHEPMYIQPNGIYANIFGHVHNNPEYVDYSSRSYCVSVERINYTPISFDDIIRSMNSCNLTEGN